MTINIGRKDNRVIPRFHFSKPIPYDPDKVPSRKHQLRYDYDKRFKLGTGPMAVDEDNRVINVWSVEMAELSDTIWKAMRGDERYRKLCRGQNQFNHCCMQPYRGGALMGRHSDRNNTNNKSANSMKPNTPVAIFTVGSPRTLSFYRRYKNGGDWALEDKSCDDFLQEEGCLFVLDPQDEAPKHRRVATGSFKEDASFVHGLVCGTKRDKDYFSIAFVFRCLDKTAVVDTTTDLVIPPPPTTAKERARREERARIREADDAEGSDFRRQVEEMQAEWRRLLNKKGWME